jgi:hypothetical protein
MGEVMERAVQRLKKKTGLNRSMIYFHAGIMVRNVVNSFTSTTGSTFSRDTIRQCINHSLKLSKKHPYLSGAERFGNRYLFKEWI